MELNRRRYLTMATATITTLTLAGCSEDEGDSGGGDANGNSGDSGSGDSNNGNGGSNDQPDVEILNHEFYEDEFTVGVRGTAVNNTDSELGYVEAEAVFLDSEGTQIGEGLDNVTDLAAGREWEFDCMFTGQDESRIDSYEIDVSTGF